MGEMRRLPGTGCRFYVRGRCLYEERLNPGYATGWRCGVLARWEEVYDDFLSRAEAFGVEDANVPGLWRDRFERLMREKTHCERYVYADDREPPCCANAHDRLCLLELPPCEGRCRKFALADDD